MLHFAGLEKEPYRNLVYYNHQRAIVTAHDIPNNRIFDDYATIPVPIYHDEEKYVPLHGDAVKVLRAGDGAVLSVDPGETKNHGYDTVHKHHITVP